MQVRIGNVYTCYWWSSRSNDLVVTGTSPWARFACVFFTHMFFLIYGVLHMWRFAHVLIVVVLLGPLSPQAIGILILLRVLVSGFAWFLFVVNWGWASPFATLLDLSPTGGRWRWGCLAYHGHPVRASRLGGCGRLVLGAALGSDGLLVGGFGIKVSWLLISCCLPPWRWRPVWPLAGHFLCPLLYR